MVEDETARERRPNPGAPEDEDLEREKQSLRALIDRFRREPETDADGLYRNLGRFIVRAVMKPH